MRVVFVFRETGEEGDSVWTQEEEDKLILWFVELESDNNVVSKLVDLFSENGMKKSKLEVIIILWCIVQYSSVFISNLLQHNANKTRN